MIRHIDQLSPLLDDAAQQGSLPWTVVGVFPTEESDGPPEAWWNSFVYTVGALPDVDLWCPCTSIEGRYAGPELTASLLNAFAAAARVGQLTAGDDVLVPLGVPGGGDIDCWFWIGQPQPARERQANLSPAPIVVPIQWTSGLGWP